MGIKYKKSVANFNRQTRKTTVTHYWITGISTKELLEDVEKASIIPKQRQKARKELQRRNAI